MPNSNATQTFIATAGNDSWTGNRNSDVAIYTATTNSGSHDVLDAGRGSDTLVLQLTRTQWFNRALQNDIAALLRQIDASCGGSANFQFSAFDLRVKDFEALKIFVDGIELSASDDRVDARDDRFTLTENASVLGNVLVNDRAPDLIREARVVSGPGAGVLTFNADGSFTYSAGSSFDWLATGQTTNVRFTYAVTDADGDSDLATVTLTIIGTNDAPIIVGGVAAGSVTELQDNAPGENTTTHVATGTLNFTDVDTAGGFTVAVTPQSSGYLGTLSVSLAGAINTGGHGHDDDEHDDDDDGHSASNSTRHDDDEDDDHVGGTTAGSGQGAVTWTFNVADSALDFLAAGETRTQYYTIIVSDGRGGTTQQVVTITITGASDNVIVNGAPQTNAASASGDEDTVLAVALSGQDADGAVHSFVISSAPLNGTLYRDAGLTQALGMGDTVVAIGNEATIYFKPTSNFNGSVSFQYAAIDNQGAQDLTPATASLTVTSVNDAATITGTAVGTTEEDASGTVAGALVAHDVDAGEAAFAVISAPALSGTYGDFSFNPLTGVWGYALANARANVQALRNGEVVHDMLTVTSLDGTAAQTIDVTITGVNDTATISALGTPDIVVTEDSDLSASGALRVADVDTGEAKFQPITSQAGSYGTFAINALGDWTYMLDNANPAVQVLNAGAHLTDSFSVVSQDGTATQTVTITINGSNDGAVIGTPTVADVTEDVAVTSGNLVATGSISLTDSDQGTATFLTTVGTAAGNLGTLNLGDNGQYTYLVSNSVVQYLGATDTKVDTFTVTSNDGTMRDVEFTIHGANDAPKILASASGGYTERDAITGSNELRTISGALQFTDTDLSDTGLAASVVSVTATGLTGGLSNAVLLSLLSLNGIAGPSGATPGSLGWTFSAEDRLFDFLPEFSNLTLDYTVAIDDQHGGVDTSTISITLTGANDTPVFNPYVRAESVEEAGFFYSLGFSTNDWFGPANVTAGELIIDPDIGDRYTVSVANLPGQPFTLPPAAGVLGKYGVLRGNNFYTTLDEKLFDYSTINLLANTPENQLTDALAIGDTADETFEISIIEQSVGGFLRGPITNTVTFHIQGRNDEIKFFDAVPNFQIVGNHISTTFGLQFNPDHFQTVGIYEPGWSYNFISELRLGDPMGTSFYTAGTGDLSYTGYLDFLLPSYLPITYSGDYQEFVGGRLEFNAPFQPQAGYIDHIGTIDSSAAGDILRIYFRTYSVIDHTDPNTHFGRPGEIFIGADQAPGSLIATLQAFDPDRGASFTYALNGEAGLGPQGPDRILNMIELVNGNEIRLRADADVSSLFDPSSGGLQQTLLNINAFDEWGERRIRQFSITLIDPNDAPIAVNDDDVGVGQFGIIQLMDGTYFGAFDLGRTGNVLSNDTDADIYPDPSTGVVPFGDMQLVQGAVAGFASGPINNDLSQSITGEYGSISIRSDGFYSYGVDIDGGFYQLLHADEELTDVFTYTMRDRGLETSTATLTIHIRGYDNPASISVFAGADQAVTEDADSKASGSMRVSDLNHDESLFQTMIVTGTYGQFSIDALGDWTYTLNDADVDTNALAQGTVGHDIFTTTSVDGSAHRTIDITVNGANDVPIATDSVARTNENGTIEGWLSALDPDHGDLLEFDLATGAAHARVTLQKDGHFVYTPDLGYSGLDEFTFSVDDGNGGVTTGRVAVTIDSSTGGAKTFVGTVGSDSFIGSGSDDNITGGLGSDLLTGGAGGDSFQYSATNEGLDTITDFGLGLDHLDFAAAAFGSGFNSGVANLVDGADISSAAFGSNDGWFYFDNDGVNAGTLYWDATGGSGSDAVSIALLQNVATLKQAELHII